MNITESEFKQLQAEIDADAKAQTARIEQERVQNHQALDRMRAFSQRTANKAAGLNSSDTLFTPTSVSGNGSSQFAMKNAIRKIIRSLGDAKVTQPLIYREVYQRYTSDVHHRNQQHVKGQIAGILGKMAESDPPELKVVDKGHGRNPRVYRATENLK